MPESLAEACKSVGLNRHRMNEQIASGVVTFLPQTTPGVPRRLGAFGHCGVAGVRLGAPQGLERGSG